MVTPILCPKCKYARRPEDTALEGQCPNCGIAYDQNAVNREKTDAPQLKKPWKLESFYVYFFTFFFGGFAWHVFRSPRVLVTAGAVFMLFSFYFWIRSYRVRRAIQDVPTSKVRSAAQGYVELYGAIEPLDERTVTGPLSGAAYVWYTYTVTERSDKKESSIEYKTESLPFLLDDGTGTCLIDPADAEVMCETIIREVRGRLTYSEWGMRPGEQVYAIGRFMSEAARLVGEKEGTARLRAWLRDPKAFLARFDTDLDGEVSRAEGDAASAAASRAAIENYIAQGGSHRLGPTGDGRPFIVATRPHNELEEYFGAANGFHIGLFVVSSLFVLFFVYYR